MVNAFVIAVLQIINIQLKEKGTIRLSNHFLCEKSEIAQTVTKMQKTINAKNECFGCLSYTTSQTVNNEHNKNVF